MILLYYLGVGKPLNGHDRRILKEIGKVVIGFSLVGFLLARIDAEKVFESVKDSNYIYILAGVAAFGLSKLFEGLRFYVLIYRYGFKVATALKLLFISIFFNNLSSVVVGDGYRIVILKKRMQNWRTPFALVLLERMAGLLVILLLGVAYIMVNYRNVCSFLLPIKFGTVDNLGLAISTAAFVSVGILILFRGRVRSAVLRLSDLIKEVKDISSQLLVSGFLLVTFLTIITHLLLALQIYILVKSFTNELLFFDSVFVVFLVFVASYVPISIGSLGVREGIVVFSLMFYGTSQTDAAAVAVLARIIIYLYAVAGGILFVLVRKGIGEDCSKGREYDVAT